jgi:hypothetical protein
MSAPSAATMSHGTPQQIVDAFIKTATTERDRLLADMLDTYRARADHWEALARRAGLGGGLASAAENAKPVIILGPRDIAENEALIAGLANDNARLAATSMSLAARLREAETNVRLLQIELNRAGAP